MEIFNKSLSARIKRRNKQGFLGVGHHVYIKRNECGDYRNLIHNHKYVVPEMVNLVNRAKKLGYKHPGSKNYKTLRIAAN